MIATALFATANGFARRVVRTVLEAGPAAAAGNLFGLTAVQWSALVAALAILAEDRSGEPVRRADWGIAGRVTLTSLVPMTGGKIALGTAVAPSDPMVGARFAAAALRSAGLTARTIRLPRLTGAVALARRAAVG